MPKPKSDSDIPATIRSLVNGSGSDSHLQKHLSWDTYVEEVLILKELEPGHNDPVRLAPDPSEPEACRFANIKMLQVMKTADGGPKPRPVRRQDNRPNSAPPRQLSLLPEEPNESESRSPSADSAAPSTAFEAGADGDGGDGGEEEEEGDEDGDEDDDEEGGLAEEGEEDDEDEEEDDEEDEVPQKWKVLSSPHPRRKDPEEEMPALPDLPAAATAACGPAASSACSRSAPARGGADAPAAAPSARH